MRIVAEIPHPQIKITVFSWNAKFIIKLEAGPYEQVYKIPDEEVEGNVEKVKAMITPEFIEQNKQRFLQMRSDFSKTVNQLQS